MPLALPVSPLPPSDRKLGVVLKDSAGAVVHRAEVDDIASNYDSAGAMSSSSASRPFPRTAPFRAITNEMWTAGLRNMNDRLRAEHESNRAMFLALPFGDGILKLSHYG